MDVHRKNSSESSEEIASSLGMMSPLVEVPNVQQAEQLSVDDHLKMLKTQCKSKGLCASFLFFIL